MIDAIITTIIWVMVLGVVGFVGYFAYEEVQYKHKAEITTRNDGNELTNIVKFKEIRDKDGSLWWKFKQFKDNYPRPPNKYIGINQKGKYFASFFQLDGGELHPVKRDMMRLDESSPEFINQVQPLTTSQRQALVSQQIKIARQKKKNLAEVIGMAVPYVALVLILAVLMIFADEAMQPMIEMSQASGNLADKMATVADKLDTVINNRIHVTDIETTGGVYNNTPPN